MSPSRSSARSAATLKPMSVVSVPRFPRRYSIHWQTGSGSHFLGHVEVGQGAVGLRQLLHNLLPVRRQQHRARAVELAHARERRLVRAQRRARKVGLARALVAAPDLERDAREVRALGRELRPHLRHVRGRPRAHLRAGAAGQVDVERVRQPIRQLRRPIARAHHAGEERVVRDGLGGRVRRGAHPRPRRVGAPGEEADGLLVLRRLGRVEEEARPAARGARRAAEPLPLARALRLQRRLLLLVTAGHTVARRRGRALAARAPPDIYHHEQVLADGRAISEHELRLQLPRRGAADRKLLHLRGKVGAHRARQLDVAVLQPGAQVRGRQEPRLASAQRQVVDGRLLAQGAAGDLAERAHHDARSQLVGLDPLGAHFVAQLPHGGHVLLVARRAALGRRAGCRTRPDERQRESAYD
eukprot:5876499-Prymnesium_polylepis.1